MLFLSCSKTEDTAEVGEVQTIVDYCRVDIGTSGDISF